MADDELVAGHVMMKPDGSRCDEVVFENSRPGFVLPQTIAAEVIAGLKRRVLMTIPLQGLGPDPDVIRHWTVGRVIEEELGKEPVAALPELVGAFYALVTARVMGREGMNILYFLVFGHMRP